MEDINYDELDPGIRNLVRTLRCTGFNTTDSGDGSKAKDMECALPFPMVTITTTRDSMCDEADRLAVLMDAEEDEGWVIEASYSPDGPAVIILMQKPYEDIN